MRTILSLILAVTLTLGVQAQRVGVVFSGGGAKGLYHIGILKALEENNIPIDYISGTSMGAIVAGLYAIGYSPDEMARLFLSDQIKYWLSGKIESEYYYYFKHMQPQQAMVTLNLDLKAEKNIAVLPTSLIPTTQLDMSFNEIFSPATAYTRGNFNRLFVPFRCVASDVYNKREVVYRDGDLGFAIRASMTIPMIFKPLKVDSLLLYDGGIYNNFPWQVLEEDFDPDVLIGGKCVKGVGNPDESNLVEQIEAITMMHTDFNLPEEKGIMISRVFDEINMLDYSKAEYIMGMGYQDTMEKIDEIKSRIARRVNPEELHNRRLAFRSELPDLVFNDYRVHGLNGDQARYVQRMMGFNENEHNTFSFPQFKSEYFRILSEGEIIGDYPKFQYVDSTGHFGVDLYLRTKPSFRLKLGGNISSTALNQAYIGLEYKTIRKNAHSLNFDGNFSALYTSVRAGWRTDFFLNKAFYFDAFFTNNHYNFQKGPHWSTFRKYGYHFLDDTYFSSSLGFPLGRSSALQLRINSGWDAYKYYEREIIHASYGSSDRSRFHYYGAQLEATKRTLNYTQYATRGIWQSVSAIAVTGREKFLPGEHYKGEVPEERATRAWIGAKYEREEYFPVNPWLTLGYLVNAVYTTLPDFYNPHATNFASPAFSPTPYSQSIYMDKYRSSAYLGVGMMPIIEFSERFYLKNSVHLFMSKGYLEDAFRKGLRQSERMRYIISSSLVYQTPIGPASLTVTNFEETSRKWFIAFNFGYTLFNKRGLFY